MVAGLFMDRILDNVVRAVGRTDISAFFVLFLFLFFCFLFVCCCFFFWGGRGGGEYLSRNHAANLAGRHELDC